MSEDNVKSVVEALLFASEKPLTIEQVKSALNHLEASHIRGIFEELKTDYEKSCRGMRVIEVAGGFQMITAPGFSVFFEKNI